MKKDYFIIYNPISGNGKAKKNIKYIKSVLSNHQKSFQVQETQYPKHAIEICQKLNFQIYKQIIAIGGDGTFNEVINGILLNSSEQEKPAIGFITGGTGNSFMHDLNAINIKTALSNILKNRTKMIDIMQLKEDNKLHFSCNIVGWGLVTDILKVSEKIRFIGGIRYNLASLYCILLKKARIANVVLDNKNEKKEYLFILSMNTIHTGKGMKAAPKALLDDGYVDVIIVENNLSTLQLLLLMPKLFSGKHIQSKFVRYSHNKNIRIIPKEDEILNIDGEMKGSTPIDIEVLPKRIKILW